MERIVNTISYQRENIVYDAILYVTGEIIIDLDRLSWVERAKSKTLYIDGEPAVTLYETEVEHIHEDDSIKRVVTQKYKRHYKDGKDN